MVHLFQRKAELNALEATVISVRTSPAPPAARDKHFTSTREKRCPCSFLPGPGPCSAKLQGPHQRQRSQTQHISSLLNSPAADGWTAAVQLSSCAPAASVYVTVAVTLRVQCCTDINFCAEYTKGKCTSLRESTVTWWNSVMATLTTRLKC